MEQVNSQRTGYARKAYDERRAEMLGQVSKAWELPVPKFDTGAPTIVEQSPVEVKNTGAISRKLQEIRIPQLTLSDESVRDAVEKLQKKSRTLDTTESDPAKRGVNIVLKLDPTKEAVDGGTKINLSLNDLPLGEALKYIASAANLKVKIEPYAVAIVPLSEPTETLISKEYKVSRASSHPHPPPPEVRRPRTRDPRTSPDHGQSRCQGVPGNRRASPFPPGPVPPIWPPAASCLSRIPRPIST